MSKGFSLIELLMVLFLSSLILTLSYHLLQIVRSTTIKDQQLIEIQDTARFVWHTFQQEFQDDHCTAENPSNLDVHLFIGNKTQALLLKCHKQKILYWLDDNRNAELTNEKGVELRRRNLSESRYVPTAITNGISQLSIKYSSFSHKEVHFKDAKQVKNWQNICWVEIKLTIKTRLYKKPFMMIFFTKGNAKCKKMALY